MGQRAIVYPRVSTAKQSDGVSLADQERFSVEYCVKQGYTVVAVVPETYSGYDTYDVRPGLQQVREMFQRGEADVLVVWRFDRASRETTDTLLLLREVSQAGGRLESVVEGPVENTPLGKAMAALRGFASETERDAMVMRTHSAIRTRAESGKILTGKNPKLGYRYVGEHKDTYELDPETTHIVRYIFDLAYRGMSLHSIANTLTREGIPTATEILQARGYPVRKAATGWRRQMVYQLLTDPSYCGRHIVYRRRVVKRRVQDAQGRTFIRQVLKLRSEDDASRIEQSIPAIVSEAVWNTVQTNLKERSLQNTRPSKVPDDTLLRGFVFCGHCGAKMVSHAHHHGYRQYRCSHRRNNAASYATPPCMSGGSAKARQVDDDVWSKVVAMGADTAHVRRMVEARQAGVVRNLNNVEQDTATVEGEIASWVQQQELLSRRMGTETDEGMYANLRQQWLAARDELEKLEVRKARIQDREKHAAMWLAAFEDVYKMLDATPNAKTILSREEKRRILRALGVRVFLYSTTSEYAKTHDTRWEFTVQQPDGDTVESMRTQNMSKDHHRLLFFTWTDWLLSA